MKKRQWDDFDLSEEDDEFDESSNGDKGKHTKKKWKDSELIKEKKRQKRSRNYLDNPSDY